MHRWLVRNPERHFTLDGNATTHGGRTYADGLGAFGSLKGVLAAHWLPRARGDDFEVVASLRGAATLGDVPLDQLYELGVERDNDLWLRGHDGLVDGRKGMPHWGAGTF